MSREGNGMLAVCARRARGALRGPLLWVSGCAQVRKPVPIAGARSAGAKLPKRAASGFAAEVSESDGWRGNR